MLLLEWIKWVLLHPCFSVLIWIDGFFVLVAIVCGTERDISYSVIPLLPIIPVTVYLVYKYTTAMSKNRSLKVDEVLSMSEEEHNGRRAICGLVVLADTQPGAVYKVSLYSPKSVIGYGYSEFSSIIERVKTVTVDGGSFDASWDELCVPDEDRTPFGKITFRRVKNEGVK